MFVHITINGNQKKWPGPSHSKLFQTISNRGSFCARAQDRGKRRGRRDGGGVVGAVALAMSVH